jgi:ribosomal protein L7/L12
LKVHPIIISDETRIAIRKAAENGDSLETLSKKMAEAGLDKVAAIKLLRETAKIDLGAAKELIHRSPAWACRRESDDVFQENLSRAFDQVETSGSIVVKRIAS